MPHPNVHRISFLVFCKEMKIVKRDKYTDIQKGMERGRGKGKV